MFSMGKKSTPEAENKATEEFVIKKAERNEEKVMENNNGIKKVDVKIGESATIIGTLRGSCIANIEGRFEGEVDLDGDLVLSRTGFVKADVKVKNAVISGTLNGTIYAYDSVQIMPTAVVNGDITSKILVIERGAKFVGTSKVLEDENKPLVNSVYGNYSSMVNANSSSETESELDALDKAAQ